MRKKHNHDNKSKLKKYKIKNKFYLIDCIQCGFIHINPTPTSEYINDFYTSHYVDKLEKQNTIDKIKTLNKLTKNKKILDIGSGDSTFLKEFKRNRWDVYGIEPSEIVKKNKGIKIFKSSFDDIDYDKIGKFGVVSLNFVLEHHPDPIKVIKIIKNKLLQKNGILLIEVPNDFNNFQLAANQIVKRKKWWVAFPDHINYFNFFSLRKLLKKNNFIIKDYMSTFPLEMFILMGENYIDNKNLGKIIHKKRVTFEKNLLITDNYKLKIKFYKSLAENNIGRTIIFYAQKKS